MPLDRLSKIDLSKLAKSQDLPSNLMDNEVNQPAGFQTTNQANQGDFPAKQIFHDMLGMDHLSDLDPKDFKTMEVDKEQAAVKALKLIHDEERT